MPEWLVKKLEKTPTPSDPKERIKAILAQAQVSTKKEKNPKVKSKLTMDAHGSRMVQISMLVLGEEGISYDVTINLGRATKDQKIDHLQESVAIVVHQMYKENISKEELKAQVADLTNYIEQWSST